MSTKIGRVTVLEADYHRNGIGGAGFYVGIVTLDDWAGRFIVTWFPEYKDNGDDLLPFQSNVAVLNLDMVNDGNVYMHQTDDHIGNNAYRGADNFADAALALQKVVDDRFTAKYDI